MKMREHLTITELQAEAADTARGHGFHDVDFQVPKRFWYLMELSWLMKIVSECGEACEAIRKGDRKNLGEELADIVIRVADTAEGMGIELEKEILRKLEINKHRPYLHGGKLA